MRYRDISQVLAVDDLVEFGSGAPEGEVKAFGVGSTAQFGALGSDVVKGGSQVVGAVSCDSLEVGIEPLDRSKFMDVLSFFEVWFNDCGPRLIGKKLLNPGLQFIDVTLCAAAK